MSDAVSSVAQPDLAGPNAVPKALRPFLPALVILFVGSGCAALIYEIVWLQMLGLVIGGSAISLGVLLGTFMGGMCLGSLLFPRIVRRGMHPLLVYGLLELLIGLLGLLELWLVPTMGDLYTHLAQPGAYAIALRSVMAGICLLPPTILMGATLPAIARYIESSPRGVSWLGFFYGGNTLGAVFGCLLAGFYLLRNYDGYTATYVAAAIDCCIALLAMGLAAMSPFHDADNDEPAAGKSAAALRSHGAWAVYVTLGLSGLTGLGAEAIWTRQLSLMLGATVYTFSNILAVFLLGLGIGSSIGSFIARFAKEPKIALGLCQFLLAGAIAWAAYSISYSLPFWPVDLRSSPTPWAIFQVNLAQCFWAVFPGALLWGASFPLGLAALVKRGQDPGRLVGGLYAANTVGAIIGSLMFSMVVMQYCGSQNAQRILLALSAISALIVLLPLLTPAADAPAGQTRVHPAGLLVGMSGGLAIALWLLVGVGGPNWGAVAWGRNSATDMPYLFPGVLHKEIPLTADEQRVLDEACRKLSFKKLDVINTTIDYTVTDESTREKVEGWMAINRHLLLSAMQKQAAPGTPSPLTVRERDVLNESKTMGLTDLKLVKEHVAYEPEDEKTRPEINAWLAANEPALVSALRKKSVAADEYRIVSQALSYGLRDLKLVAGKLDWKAPANLSKESADAKWAWINTNRADLTAALQHRADATGTGNLFPYDEKQSTNRYCVYLGEGMNVSVAVTYDPDGYRYFHGAGKVQASSNPDDMRLQRSLGHISALTNFAQTDKTPQDVLVVACGAGVTAGSFVPYGSNITIVDIEPMVPRYVTPQFADSNHDVIPPEISGRPTGYKKTHVVIDDGRHYIRTVKQKFDVITSDPIDPWVKGCAALNTVEYYQMCKEHLKPGGIMALWIPFYESSEETTKSVIATFFKVFPNGIIWSNDQQGQGYDAVLFGSVDLNGNAEKPLKLNIDKIQDYLDDPNHAAIKRSLQDVHFGESSIPGTCEAVELLATYAGTAPRMTRWTAGTDKLINTDRNLRLQYIAGMYINNNDAALIFDNILANYSWPDEIFSGKPERIAALKELLSMTKRQEHSAPPPAAGNNQGPASLHFVQE
jgi:spermidine synthase